MNSAANTATEHVLFTGKTVTYLNVRSKDCVRFGKAHEGRVDKGHNAQVTPGKSIRLFGTMSDRYVPGPDGVRIATDVKYDLTFNIGDRAERDAYNIVYTGTIVAIGAKTVTIQHDHSSRKTRLTIEQFSRKNRDYDAAAIRARNSSWMD